MAFDSVLSPILKARPGVVEIELTQGYIAIVDAADYELHAKGKTWYAHKARNNWYAARRLRRDPETGKRPIEYLHRVIVNAQPGWVVDHENEVSLDCTRNNLRVCGYNENAANVSWSDDTVSSTGYRGVTRERSGRFRARIGKDHLGMFDSALEAANAWDAAMLMKFGEFAKTNAMRDLSPRSVVPVCDSCPF